MAAKLVNILHRSIHFYVNKPKFIVEIFSSETFFFCLTLFRGGVTRFNKIIRTFANVFFTENDKTLFNITNILKQNKYEKKTTFIARAAHDGSDGRVGR